MKCRRSGGDRRKKQDRRCSHETIEYEHTIREQAPHLIRKPPPKDRSYFFRSFEERRVLHDRRNSTHQFENYGQLSDLGTSILTIEETAFFFKHILDKGNTSPTTSRPPRQRLYKLIRRNFIQFGHQIGVLLGIGISRLVQQHSEQRKTDFTRG